MSRVAIGRRMLVVAVVVSPVGQAGYVGVVEVDVGGLGRLAIGVMVAVVIVVVMVVVGVGVGHGVGSAQASHGLLHVDIVWGRLNLEGPLRGVGLVAIGVMVVPVHVVDVVAEQPAVTL